MIEKKWMRKQRPDFYQKRLCAKPKPKALAITKRARQAYAALMSKALNADTKVLINL